MPQLLEHLQDPTSLLAGVVALLAGFVALLRLRESRLIKELDIQGAAQRALCDRILVLETRDTLREKLLDEERRQNIDLRLEQEKLKWENAHLRKELESQKTQMQTLEAEIQRLYTEHQPGHLRHLTKRPPL